MRHFLLMLAVAGCAWGAGFRAGAAEVVITPPLGAPMAGYYENRAATGVIDELHAKAVVFEVDGARIALVACDVANLPRQISDEARRIVQTRSGIPAANVMISATHSHTGPVIYTLPSRYNLQGEMKRIAVEYTADLPAKIAEAVVAANANLRPAQLRSAIGQESSLPFNRRYFLQDGTVAWNPGKLNPKVVKPAGPVDPSVPLLVIETPEGRAIAAYVNYSMHPDTTGGLQFSADYPGTLTKILRMAKGSQLITLFTIGAAGNVNHIDVNQKERQSSREEAARIGAVLAGEALRAWKQSKVIPVSRLRVSGEMVRLPVAELKPGDVEWAQATAATFGKAKPAPFIDLVRAARVLDVANQKGKPWEAEVQVIAVDREVAFVSIPGEYFVELGITMKQDSPFPNTIIAELANGALGYIPNRKAFREGAYEVISSRFAPGAGELLLDSALRQLAELAQRP